MKQKTKLTAIRSVLAILILLNMGAIFFFSAQSGEESGQTSSRVTRAVARVVVSDFDDLSDTEQEAILARMHPTVRKLAHMTEFGALGAWVFLLLLTYSKPLPICYLSSSGFVLLYACTDEWHQLYTAGRGPSVGDVMIDLCGALICGGCLCLLVLLIRRNKQHPARTGAERKLKHRSMKLQCTHYTLPAPREGLCLRIAVAADLHNAPHKEVVEHLRAESPDLILIPGDLMDDVELGNAAASGYEFLRLCAAIAPTYYSVGNHEIACYHKGNPWRHPLPHAIPDEVRIRIRSTGAILLDNEARAHGEITVCGLTSGINGDQNEPNAEVLRHFAALGGVKLLLCHHPEYFMPFIRKTDIALTVCGHAHGGQWRFFGRGVYAPGQGLLPRYTAGVIENRCVISRGLGNHTRIPRICNRPELVIIQYGEPRKQLT